MTYHVVVGALFNFIHDQGTSQVYDTIANKLQKVVVILRAFYAVLSSAKPALC